MDDARSFFEGPRGRRWVLSRSRGWLGGVALVVLCAALYLPGAFAMPTVDRDEARFAQASRQMFESVALSEGERDEALHGGGLVVPRFGSEDRLNTPPLVYWAQAGSAALFTGGEPSVDAVWMYRVPSALFAALAVLATWRIGVGALDPRAGWLGAALLAACPVVVWEAHQARADQLLLACTAGAMWGLWRCASGRPGSRFGWAGAAVLWVSMGLGILAKGPIVVLVVGLAAVMLAVTRGWGVLLRIRPVMGVVILGVVVAPWAVLVTQRVGFEALWGRLTGETIGRASSAMEGHWGPPGYHLALLAVLFWPGVLLASLGVVRAWRRARPLASVRRGVARGAARGRGRLGEMFLLAWALPGWVVFELVATKQPQDTMVLYPALALLTGRGLLAAGDGALDGVRHAAMAWGYWLWLMVGAVWVAVLPMGLGVWVGVIEGRWAVMAGALVLSAAGAWVLLRRSWRDLMAGEFVAAQAWSVAVFALGAWALVGVVLPRLETVWVSDRLAREIERLDPARERPVASAGYAMDSLLFETRGRVEFIAEDAGALWLGEHPRGILITTKAEAASMRASVRRPFEDVVTVAGLNLSRLEFVNLVVGGRAGSFDEDRDR